VSRRERTISFVFKAYKLVVSPALHAVSGQSGACRFQPTCSEYAALALAEYGLLRGGWMAFRRIMRCHPFSKGGFDPVPPNHSRLGEACDISHPVSKAFTRAN